MPSILTWNIAGAKFLGSSKSKRAEYSVLLNKSISDLVDRYSPDFILLQESVCYSENTELYEKTSIIQPPDNYKHDFTPTIDTTNQSHPMKWEKYYNTGKWGQNSYIAQGHSILWKSDFANQSLWAEIPDKTEDFQKEIVRLDTGLYTGTRDSEPRSLVVTRFYSPLTKLNLIMVNIHLTTLHGEREYIFERDIEGSRIRIAQIKTVLKGVISRYNNWLKKSEADSIQPIWILAGDFNCQIDSQEIEFLKRMGFTDINPDKGLGTKRSIVHGSSRSITVDYIFIGATQSFNPVSISKNPAPINDIQLSDHYPVFGEF